MSFVVPTRRGASFDCIGNKETCSECELERISYECDKCGMSVNATCGKCDTPLVNDHLVLDDGSSVQISKCPSCLGKIKSPQCCGEDMVCEV